MTDERTPLAAELLSMFWEKVAKRGHDECWEWTAGKSGGGYGRFYIRRRAHQAHRFAWRATCGPIPDGMFVCHRCDNPSCCNPRHLFLGTPKDNMRDMSDKGRWRSPQAEAGEKNGNARLTLRDVRRMRKMYAAGMGSCRQLGRHFGVCNEHVSKIVRGLRWAK